MRPTRVPSGEATTVLVDALVHDARNPLNALSIHVEVMAERFRREHGGVIPPAHEKSLKTMSEQVARVDAILRLFADLLAPRPGGDPRPELAALVQDVLGGIAHECRKRQVALRPRLEPGVRAAVPNLLGLRALVVNALVAAALRTPAGTELHVQVSRREGSAVLAVDGCTLPADPTLTAAAQELGGRWVECAGGFHIELGLVLDGQPVK